MGNAHWTRHALLGGLLSVAFAVQAQTTYRVGVALRDVGMYAVNDTGSMVGETMYYQEGALLYANGILTDLTPRGPGAGAAYDINNAGTVVGTASFGTATRHAFVYRNGTLRALDPSAPGPSEALGINDRGQIVGWGIDPAGHDSAFVYTRGQMRYLQDFPGSGNARAQAINNRGQIVGVTNVADGLPGPDPQHAFIYENGVMRPLDVPGYDSWASDINDAGQIVGGASVTGVHGYLYDHGRVTDIGNFGGARSYARGINNLGQVVGVADQAQGDSHAFLFADGVLTDLSSITPGWEIYEAYDINDKQQIVGLGCTLVDRACYAVRLDPVTAVPEPAHWAMLGIGAVLSGLLRRRRGTVWTSTS